MKPQPCNNLKTLLRLIVALWAVLLLAGGCGEAGSASMSDGDVPSDGDTTADGDEPGTGVVGLELTPPSELGLLPQQVAGLNLETFDGRIVLKRSVTYSGEVRLPDGEAAESTITLAPSSLASAIPGRPLPNTTISTNELSVESPKSEFSVSTLVGVYTLYVFPKSDWEERVPPIVRHDGLEIETDAFDVLWYERGLQVKGIVTSANGSPLPLVKVTAFAGNPWMRSSVALTSTGVGMESEAGEFTLALSTEPATYDLVVQASSQDPLKPKLTVENVLAVENNQVRLIGDTDREGRLLVAYEPFARTVCRMNGQVKGYKGKPVAAAKLIFTNAIGGGIFSATATTDDSGAFSVDLLQTDAAIDQAADDYRISVVPPVEGEDAAVLLSAIDCPSPSVSLPAIELSHRLKLSGQVTDPYDQALAGATVQAWKTPDGSAANVYIKTTLTDNNGDYELFIDAGTYTLSFIPPAGSGLARSILQDIQTSTDAVIDQRVSTGQVFSGQVFDADGNPVPWTFIEVFRERPASGDSESIGSGSCDEHGVFQILIP
jgi:hypothetical protein